MLVLVCHADNIAPPPPPLPVCTFTTPLTPSSLTSCAHPKRPRLYQHHVRMCCHMLAWCRYTRGRMLNVHTWVFAHHTTRTHHDHHDTHTHDHNNNHHNNTRRQGQRETEKERQRKRDRERETREEKRGERRREERGERREERGERRVEKRSKMEEERR